MKYNELIQLYFERSNALQAYWTLYVVILGGLLAFSSLRKQPAALTTAMVTLLFALFAFKNLDAIHDVTVQRVAVLDAIKQTEATTSTEIQQLRATVEPTLIPATFASVKATHLTADFSYDTRALGDGISPQEIRDEPLGWRGRPTPLSCHSINGCPQRKRSAASLGFARTIFARFVAPDSNTGRVTCDRRRRAVADSSIKTTAARLINCCKTPDESEKDYSFRLLCRGAQCFFGFCRTNQPRRANSWPGACGRHADTIQYSGSRRHCLGDADHAA